MQLEVHQRDARQAAGQMHLDGDLRGGESVETATVDDGERHGDDIGKCWAEAAVYTKDRTGALIPCLSAAGLRSAPQALLRCKVYSRL